VRVCQHVSVGQPDAASNLDEALGSDRRICRIIDESRSSDRTVKFEELGHSTNGARSWSLLDTHTDKVFQIENWL
jgi:hypothetical protein